LPAILDDAQSDFPEVFRQLLLPHTEHLKELYRHVSELDVAEVQRSPTTVVYSLIKVTSATLQK